MRRARRSVPVVCFVVAVLSAPACASVLGIDDPIPVGSDAAAFDAADTADAANDRAASDAHLDALGDRPGDALDAQADACVAVTPDESKAIFVSLAGTAAACGSKAIPCNSIQLGISRASALLRSLVYVDRGTYVEAVTLAPGVTVQGGWDDVGSVWSRQCDPSSATIQSPGSSNVTVLADGITGSAGLDTLTIASKDPNAVGAGESLYGVLARGATTTLTLNDVIVKMGAAGGGANGSPGGDGTNGGQGCSSDTGNSGNVGGPGGGATAGTFSSAGYNPSSGAPGASGTNGANGIAPTPAPTCTSQCGSCFQDPISLACSFNPGGFTNCGTSGTSGCSGAAGSGGGGGGGGGSSIAVFVWGAQVTASSSDLRAGSGGAGGDGAPGGFGGNGGAGTAGSASPSCTVACDVNCGPINDNGVAGGAGGFGGAGGKGGQGGGGAGGFSYAIYVGGSGVVNAATTTLSAGSPGAGGNPGGAPGQAANRFP